LNVLLLETEIMEIINDVGEFNWLPNVLYL